MDFFKVFKGIKNTKAPITKPKEERLYPDLSANLIRIKETLGNANDLLVRQLSLQDEDYIGVAILGIDGLIDTNQAEQFIVQVLSIDLSIVKNKENRSYGIFQSIFESRIAMLDAKCGQTFQDLYTNLLTVMSLC